MTGAAFDYPAFHRALNRGQEPLPWQARLATKVATDGWPGLIGVPTGLGKTTCIDIAVWALQQQHDRQPSERTAPTRTWYVVNRRLLVDAAHDRASRLARFLADPTAAAAEEGYDIPDHAADLLREVGHRLQTMAASSADNGMPLHVALLRGGAALSDRPLDPSQPALLFATVPMFATRWLFRGYGTSRTMRPVDAALAGIDSLVLLDEAHLSRPLRKLAQQAAEADLGDPATLLPAPRSRPVLVALTATGDHPSDSDVLELDDDDLAHPVVQQRLSAHKPVVLVSCTRTTLAKTLADEARGLHAAMTGAAVVVFTNSPRTAREVARLLTPKDDAAPEVVLLTGLMREREAAATRDRLLDASSGVASGRSTEPRARGLTVVATQTLEVGADLDFDGLVTETAGVRALTQRIGRLNRLGERNPANGQHTAVVCHPTDAKGDGLYGDEPDRVWDRLSTAGDGADLGPGSIAHVLGTPEDEPPRSGELLTTHVWEMAKTTAPPPGEAPPEVFYDGIGEPERHVSVAWRSWLPERAARLEPPLDGSESVDVPLARLRELLEDRGLIEVHVLDADRARLELIPTQRLRPGHQVMLRSAVGGYGTDGWDLTSRMPVLDVAATDASSVLISAATMDGLLAPTDEVSRKALAELARRIDEEELEAPAEIVPDLLEILEAAEPHTWLVLHDASRQEWSQFLEGFRSAGQSASKLQVRMIEGGLALVQGWHQRDVGPRLKVAVEALDDLSFTATSAVLGDHLHSVGAHARHIAEKVGLAPAVAETVGLAGADHDLGKQDPRFQRWLGADAGGPTLAKSRWRPDPSGARQRAAGWPQGGRHEAISGRILQALDPSVDPLRLHLVLSHHGRGRPSFAPVDDAAGSFTVEINGQELDVSADLSKVDWDQPFRFRRLCESYGVWGLALLEAIVRQADHQVSSVVEVV